MKHRSIFLIILLVMAVLVTAGCSSRSYGTGQTVPAGDSDSAEAKALAIPQTTAAGAVTGTPGANCRKGLSTCNGYCRDLSVDISNCGYCGNACPNGWGNICREGMCTCKEGLSNCDGLCWDLINDNRNCGECGNICPTGKVCNSGTCSICGRGLVECNPGQCAYLEADAKNCGVCGNICPAGQRCIKGQCGGSVCSAPRGYCGGNCYDLSSDGINCGSCGNICQGATVCQAGSCVLLSGSGSAVQQPSGQSCPTLQNNCGGTCVNLLEDNNNCGRCNNPCKTGERCSSGRCIGTSSGCTGYGETSCNGVCMNTLSDSSNCGGCSITCHCPASADPSIYCIPSCSFGKCYVGCTKVVSAGTGSVIVKTYDSLMTDPNNCGACFKVCPSGKCLNGQCSM